MTAIRAVGALLILAATIIVPGCDSSENDQNDHGSETHWLKICRSTAECGDLQCICGVCTLECSAPADCLGLGAQTTCGTSQAVSTACVNATAPAAGLCLAPCAATKDCQSGNSCVSGACVQDKRDGGGAGSPDASGTGGAVGASGGTAGAAAKTGGTSGIADAGSDSSMGGSSGGAGGRGAGGTPTGTGGASLDSSMGGGAGGGAGGISNGGKDSGSAGRDAALADSSAGGASSDGGVTKPSGHLVLIGHDYSTHGPNDERILSNAVFLANTQGTVRVLEFDALLSSPTDASTFVTSYAGTIGRSVTFTEVTDSLEVPSKLPSTDVLLIDPMGALVPPLDATALVTEWAPMLNSFLASGGVVIVLSGNSGGAMTLPGSINETHRMASGPRLLYLPQYAGSTAEIEVATPSDPVATGVGSVMPGAWNDYLTFPNALGGTVVVRDQLTRHPVVIHLALSNCRGSIDCSQESTNRMCDVVTGKCVACQTDLECQPKEHCTAGSCFPEKPCTTFLDCQGEPENRTVCNATSAVCVECVTGADCKQGQTCAAGNVCRTACTDDAPCSALSPPFVCDPTLRICTRCVTSAQCPSNEYCELGRCVHDTCSASGQFCYGNAIQECDPTGASTTPSTCSGRSVCTESGGATSCVTLPWGPPCDPLECVVSDFCKSVRYIYQCCTPTFECGCSQTPPSPISGCTKF